MPALDGVSFQVNAGEIFGLLGPNGGGKTTLFKILSTLFPLDLGQAVILGADVAQEPGKVRRNIGVVFQSSSLDKKLTVLENMRYHGRLYGMKGQDLSQKISQALKTAGLEGRAGDLAERLSGGLMRRLEIAKGILHGPKLFLMDEPTTGLDPGARLNFWGLLNEIRKDGVSVLLTTHLMEEAERCDRIGILSQGRLVALGTPQALKEEIGGDVITVETKDPGALSGELKRKFGLPSTVVDGTVRIERAGAHEFVPQLVQSFPEEIVSVRVSKPSLEDVFVKRTGHKFWRNGHS